MKPAPGRSWVSGIRLLGGCLRGVRVLAGAAPPNSFLILADDRGDETLGGNGGTSDKTPTRDQLAARGVGFDHCLCHGAALRRACH